MRKTSRWDVWSPDAQLYAKMLRRIGRAEAKNRPTLRGFADWLAKSRGLAVGTIRVRMDSASTFVDAATSGSPCSCPRALRSVTVRQIEDFFIGYVQGRGIAARRNMATAMRSFLEFAAERGWVGPELAEAVPSLTSYRLGHLPRRLDDEQLTRLLTAPWMRSRCPRRDRAIVWLLASYGVRRSQVSALQLADIDWQERTIRFAAHKGGKAIQHVLTDPVAHALAEYLARERPASESGHVFVQYIRPHVRLAPDAITRVVSVRAQRCGLPPLSPHVLRHAFATRLLRAGQPIKAIADLLGHRSLGAVSVYAKVDWARLLQVALDWPEVGP